MLCNGGSPIQRKGGNNMESNTRKGQWWKKLLLRLPLIIGVLVLCFAIVYTLGGFDKGNVKIITSSTLTKVIDISELSTAQFTYNGIAEIYKDNKPDEVECYIRYNAKVKTGIDMSDVRFEIDDDAMTVRPILPEIIITSSPVDEKSLSFIPANATVEISEALIACKEDSLREATALPELLETAGENLKSIIEALLYPIITPKGYSILWN
jgi:hypothetical protein